MAKTISVKVEGTADFQAVSRRLQQVFAATGREAQSAADKVEGQFERAASSAQSSALKISRAFAGVNDDLSNVGDGFDAKALAGRIEAAFGRISTSNLLDAAGIDSDARRITQSLQAAGVMGTDLRDRFSQLGLVGNNMRATFAGLALAGTNMRDSFRQAGASLELGELQERMASRTAEAVARMRASLASLPPEGQIMVNRLIAEMERFAARGPDEAALAMDRVRAAIRTLPPEMANAANRMLGDMQRAAQQTPDLWDRSNVKIANDLRELGGRLPRQLVGVAAEIANQLDPRPYTERKYDDLQDELARVARSLPPEFQSAARRIQGELSAAAKKIPPPFARAAEAAAENMDDLVGDARRTGDQVADQFERAARRSESAFDGMGRRIGSKFGDIGRIAAGNLLAELTSTISSSVISPTIRFAADAPQLAFNAEGSINALRTQAGDAIASRFEQFALNDAPKLGISPTLALEASSQILTQQRQLGFTAAEAEQNTKDNLRILAAIKATNPNLTDQEAVQVLTAPDRGEFDSIQRYIPLINAARVEQEALALSGKTNKKALTELDKARAVQSLKMKGNVILEQNLNSAMGKSFQTMQAYEAELDKQQFLLGKKLIPAQLAFKKAQVDVATFMVGTAIPAVERWNNQFRIKYAHQILDVKAAISDFFDGLRQGFTAGDVSKWQTAGVTVRSFFESLFTGKTQNETATTVERVGLAIRNGFQWLVDNKDEIKDAFDLAIEKLVQFGPAGLAAFGAFSLLSKAGPALSALTGVLPKLATGLPALLASATGGPITIGIALTAATIGGLVLAYQHSERFRDAVNGIKDKVVEALPKLQEFVSGLHLGPALQAAAEAGESLLVLFATLTERMAGDLIPVLSALAPILGPIFNSALDSFTAFATVVAGLADTVTALINGDWRAAWDSFTSIIDDAIKFVANAITPGLPWGSLLNGLSSTVTSIGTQINRLITGFNSLPGPDVPLISLGGGKQVGKVAKPTRAATGHVAFNEQMLIVGDNRGARTDPELISPKSHIASAVADGVSRALEGAQLGGGGFNIGQVVVHRDRDIFSELAGAARLFAA